MPEWGGSKVTLLEAGGFDDVDAAPTIHPYRSSHPSVGTLASASWDVTFRDVPAQAARRPPRGPAPGPLPARFRVPGRGQQRYGRPMAVDLR